MTKSSIPLSWRQVKFGDVVDNMNETTRSPASIGLDRIVGLDHMDPESLPLKRWDNLSDLHEGTSFTRVFRTGQVLFGKRRAYQRKVSLPDFDGICSGDILVFQPKNEALLPKFLPFLVQSNGFFDHALGTSAGSLSPRTKWQELAKYEFVLPPIAEQHRIANALKTIELNRNSFNLAKKAALIQKNALMNWWIFNGAEGMLGKLEDHATLNPGGVTLSEEDPFVPMDALPFLQRRPDYFEQKGSRGGVRARAGDVLFARITPCLENGKICQVPSEIEVCGGSTELIVIRTKGEVSQDLLFHWATFEPIRQRAANLMIGTTGRQRLMAKDLGTLPFRKLSFQMECELVETLNQIEKVVGLLDLQLQECKSLEWSIRELLLAGKDV